MLILVGPSASGKTQVVQNLIRNYHYQKMVTYTTRSMRVNEVDGIDYYFLTMEEFNKRIDKGFFFEHVTYNGNCYGTSISSITNNKVVILEPSGIKYYKDRLSNEVTIIYLFATPSMLQDRMRFRGDSEEAIIKRLSIDKEVFNDSIISLCDYVIDTTNYSLDEVSKMVNDFYQSSLNK